VKTSSCSQSASATTRRGAVTLPGADGFLNVDLEVGARTRAALGPLVDAVDGTLFELFRGRIRSLYRAHYESSGCHEDASATIRALATVIEGLPRPARRAWDAATLRDFNVGVELERGVRSVELAIDPDVVSRVAALGGRIAFTAYQVAAMRKPRRR
jgi:hypothetical protein